MLAYMGPRRRSQTSVARRAATARTFRNSPPPGQASIHTSTERCRCRARRAGFCHFSTSAPWVDVTTRISRRRAEGQERAGEVLITSPGTERAGELRSGACRDEVLVCANRLVATKRRSRDDLAVIDVYVVASGVFVGIHFECCWRRKRACGSDATRWCTALLGRGTIDRL